MRTVTVRELKSNPSAALRDAREGPVLVLNRGTPEALLVSVAGESGGAGLEREVTEAVAIIQRLAERRGSRAIQAIDRAAARRVGEQPTGYASSEESGISLATLAVTLQVIAAPRRIVRRPATVPGDRGTIVVVVDHEPGRAELTRIDAVAAAAGRRVVVQVTGGPDNGEALEGDLIFDHAAVPMGAIDRLIADGSARPPSLQGPFPRPRAAPSGRSAAGEIIRERDEEWT